MVTLWQANNNQNKVTKFLNVSVLVEVLILGLQDGLVHCFLPAEFVLEGAILGVVVGLVNPTI